MHPVRYTVHLMVSLGVGQILRAIVAPTKSLEVTEVVKFRGQGFVKGVS